MALTDANTYPTQGILNSQIMSTYDIAKPQYARELSARFGLQYMPFFQRIRAMGREKPVESNVWYGNEENRYHDDIKVLTATPEGGAAGGDPGAGNISVLVLDSSKLDSNNNFYPRVGDAVSIPGTYVQAQITDIDVTTPTAPAITIKPFRSTDNIGEIEAGTLISITNGAFADGTGQPNGTRVGTTKRTFYTQIFKETVEATGGQLALEKWYKITDNGKNIDKWYTPGIGRAEYLMALKMDGAFTWGVNADQLASPADDPNMASETIYTTKGYIPWIKELGETIDISAGFDTTDLDDAAEYFRGQAVTGGNILTLAGTKFHTSFSNEMKDFIDNNGTDYLTTVKTMFKGDGDLAAAFDFHAVKKAGFTFVLADQPQWSDPKTFGNTGYNMNENAVMIPLSTFKDPKSGKMLQNIGTRYRAKGDYSRRFEMWTVAGAGGGTYVHDVDKRSMYIRAEVGLEMYKGNQCIFMEA